MEAELIFEDDVDPVEVAKKAGITGLILGIIGVVVGGGGIFACPWTAWVTLPLSIVGIVKSVRAIKVPEASGMGTAGLVLSIIGAVVSAIGSVWAIIMSIYVAFIVVYLVVVVVAVAGIALTQ